MGDFVTVISQKSDLCAAMPMQNVQGFKVTMFNSSVLNQKKIQNLMRGGGKTYKKKKIEFIFKIGNEGDKIKTKHLDKFLETLMRATK